MAQYKLTITDLETGKIECEKGCDGIMLSIVSREQDRIPAPESFFMGHKLSGIEVVSLLIATDDSREKLFAENPAVALGYHIRDRIFPQHMVVDINELEKQVGAK